jgi:hypothetical protein
MRAAVPPPKVPVEGQVARGRRESQERRRKTSLLPLKVLVVWLLLLGGVVWWFQRNAADEMITAPVVPDGAYSDADIVFLNEVLPICYNTLTGFLSETTPEARAQYVLNPLVSGPRMARFYALNPAPGLKTAGLEHLGSAILKLPEGRAIESRWRTSDRRVFESVFRQEGGQWRLDWEHFARYGDYPWMLFLTGGGSPEGEFRLWAWERLADSRNPGDPLSVMFHAPKFAQPDEIDRGSPEFVLDPASPMGRFLDETFKARRKGLIPFNSQLALADPRDMIRVRVRVARVAQERGFTFELKEVIAGHWLEIDDTGKIDLPTEETSPEAEGLDAHE